MKKWLKVSSYTTLGLGALSFCCLIYNIIAFEYFRPRTINFEELGPNADTLSLFIYLGLFVMFVFHISAILTTVYQMQLFGSENNIRRVTLIIGIISFMTIFADFGLLSDIGKESRLGWDVKGEWIILYLTLIPQILFYILIFISVMTGLRSLRNKYLPEKHFKDETVFYAVHYTGLLCGAFGLLATFMKFIVHTALWNLKFLVVYDIIFIIIPYSLVAFYWLFMKRKEKLADWYDEKQFLDISKSGFLTLLFSLPCMAVLYVINYLTPGGKASILWFPFYLYFVLVFFSGTTLYLKES